MKLSRKRLYDSLNTKYIKGFINEKILFKAHKIITEESSDVVSDKGLEDNKTVDHSYLLHLEKLTLPYITKITKIPDIEEVETKLGKGYRVKYFLKLSNHGTAVIGFLSYDKSFKTVKFMEFFNPKGIPIRALEIRKLPKEGLIKVFKKTAEKLENKKITESFESEATKYSMWIGWFLGFMSMGILTYLLFKRVIFKYQEFMATGRYEGQINKELFTGQREDDPAFIIYNNMENAVKSVVRGKSNGAIIYGPPGTSKSYIVRRVLHFSELVPRRDYVYEKGSNVDIKGVYQVLYDCRNKILILDDFDGPLLDQEITNLLKAATDSYTNKILSLRQEKRISSSSDQEAYLAPSKFKYDGKMIIITNLSKDKIDTALLSRLPSVEVNFNTKEVIENVEKMLEYINPSMNMDMKREVYDYILTLYRENPNIKLSFRSFKVAIDARYGNPESWKDTVRIMVGATITESYIKTKKSQKYLLEDGDGIDVVEYAKKLWKAHEADLEKINIQRKILKSKELLLSTAKDPAERAQMEKDIVKIKSSLEQLFLDNIEKLKAYHSLSSGELSSEEGLITKAHTFLGKKAEVISRQPMNPTLKKSLYIAGGAAAATILIREIIKKYHEKKLHCNKISNIQKRFICYRKIDELKRKELERAKHQGY